MVYIYDLSYDVMISSSSHDNKSSDFHCLVLLQDTWLHTVLNF